MKFQHLHDNIGQNKNEMKEKPMNHKSENRVFHFYTSRNTSITVLSKVKYFVLFIYKYYIFINHA